jgi:hypothetical protein
MGVFHLSNKTLALSTAMLTGSAPVLAKAMLYGCLLGLLMRRQANLSMESVGLSKPWRVEMLQERLGPSSRSLLRRYVRPVV